MNFFSGHNMANEIMQKTSLTMQLKEYVHDYATGKPQEEFYPERLDPDYETKKPFLISTKQAMPEPELTPDLAPEVIVSSPIILHFESPKKIKPVFISEKATFEDSQSHEKSDMEMSNELEYMLSKSRFIGKKL